MATTYRARARVAIIPWGSPIEQFLDPLEQSLDDFCERITGGWLFGYAEALETVGYSPSIVVISRACTHVHHRTHRPTGTPIVVVPARRTSGFRRAGLLRDLASYRQAMPRGLLATLAAFDAVIVQEYEDPRSDLLAWWGRLHRIPVLASFQGGTAPWEADPIQRIGRGLSMRRLAGLLIGSQPESGRVLRSRRIRPNRVHRVWNPVSADVWVSQDRDQARRTLQIPGDAKVVTWHGRVEMQRKGLDLLLVAWKAVCSEMPHEDVRLLLVGSGHDNELLRSALNADQELRGITWWGEYAPGDVVRRHVAACDLWVSPSRHEGFAVAPLEAMASARAVILADAPGMAEILGASGAGRLVPIDDPDALARAIVESLRNPDWLGRSGVLARQRVESDFSQRAIGMQLKHALEFVGCLARG